MSKQASLNLVFSRRNSGHFKRVTWWFVHDKLWWLHGRNADPGKSFDVEKNGGTTFSSRGATATNFWRFDSFVSLDPHDLDLPVSIRVTWKMLVVLCFNPGKPDWKTWKKFELLSQEPLMTCSMHFINSWIDNVSLHFWHPKQAKHVSSS